MGGLAVLLFVCLVGGYVGGRCLWLYYKLGFYPPGDKIVYRNSAWIFTTLGVLGTIAIIILGLGLSA